jgi:hypothetical protein
MEFPKDTKRLPRRFVAPFGSIHHTGVILKDFSLEEPALSEVEWISRVPPPLA